MRTFVIGDIHGAYKALLQCFKRCSFDYDNDRLIALGDVCDGWPEVRQSIDELLKVKNLIYIVGNHDLWALSWGLQGTKEDIWLGQGGKNTIVSYDGGPMPESHIKLLQQAFGAGRMVWGTGYPGHHRVKHKWPTLQDELRLVREGLPFLSAAEQDRILGGTAAEIWNLA